MQSDIERRVREEVAAKCALATQLFHVDLSKLEINFMRGRSAGKAQRTADGRIIAHFNATILEANPEEIAIVVPHELAHIIGYLRPSLGARHHNYGWWAIDNALGGTGSVRHSYDVVYAHGHTYEYTATCGTKTRVSKVLHERIQGGQVRTLRRTGGKVTATCAFSVIGSNGLPLATPVHVEAANSPKTVQNFALQSGSAAVATAPTLASRLGLSKAACARRLMQIGYQQGNSYEEIIQAMMRACGYNRNLARATFKVNAARAGVPEDLQ